MWWLGSYGNGIFVPLRDATAGSDDVRRGRYLLDTVKGADLGREGDGWVIDLNFSYNPSCAYDPGWACPLAPLGNRLRPRSRSASWRRSTPRHEQAVHDAPRTAAAARGQRRERHRAVDLASCSNSVTASTPGGGELGPDLADPRLGVGLGGEALVGVLLRHPRLAAGGVVAAATTTVARPASAGGTSPAARGGS